MDIATLLRFQFSWLGSLDVAELSVIEVLKWLESKTCFFFGGWFDCSRYTDIDLL